MKKYLCLIISLLNAVATAIYIALIDKDIVPIHYDFNGNVDNEGSKWSFMFLPAILVVMAVVFIIIEKFMAKNINYQKNSKYLTICITGFYVLMLAMFWVLLILSTNGDGKILSKAVPFVCSVILGLIGVLFSNFMPKIKPNGTFGIRVSATLNNETVWKKTHRFAGKTGMVGSFLVLITSFVSLFCGDFSAVVSIVGIVIFVVTIAVLPTIYAYRVKANMNKG